MDAQRITASDIESYITPQRLRPLWIVQFGLILGPIFFAIVIFIIHSMQASYHQLPQSEMMELMMRFSWINIYVSAGCFLLVTLTFQFPDVLFRISPQNGRLHLYRDSRTGHETNPVCLLMSKLNIRILFRLALLEIPAMIGLVICLIGVQSGVVYEEQAFFVNAVPAIVFVIYAISTVPTRDRVIAKLEQLSGSA